MTPPSDVGRATLRLGESEVAHVRPEAEHPDTSILDCITEAYQICDSKWRITYMNPTARDFFVGHGFDPDSVIGKHFFDDLFPATRNSTSVDHMLRSMAERVSVTFESYYAPWNMWLLFRFDPLPDGGLATSFREITGQKKAEEARRPLQRERDEPLARLQLEFERMPIACAVFDTQSRIIGWNPAAEAIFGYRREEVLGKYGPSVLFPTAIPAPLEDVLRRLSAGDMNAHSVNENVTKDGRVITCEWHNTPLRDDDGHPTGVLSMAQNITDRRRIQEALTASEERLRLASTTLAGFLNEWEPATNRLEWFGGLEEVLGFPLDEVTPDLAWYESRVHPDDLARAWACVRAAFETGALGYTNAYRFRHRDGHYVDVLDRGRIVRDEGGHVVRVVGGVSDVSERRSFERELERSNAELDQFASIASHDMQEPLRTISIYVQLLAERYRARLDGRADVWIEHVVRAVGRTQNMVSGLLALARLRTDGHPLAPTDTAEVVGRTWVELLRERVNFHARLTCSTLPTIVADPAQIEQLFQNLLGNAIKYRSAGVALTVDVSAERRDNGEDTIWEFAVRDNGIGLDMAHAGRVFQLFQRLHREEAYEGTGMGLAICKKIVERHGGWIRVESAPGKGATFRFTLLERAR